MSHGTTDLFFVIYSAVGQRKLKCAARAPEITDRTTTNWLTLKNQRQERKMIASTNDDS